ncbi:MAG: hypothetical protein AB3N12_01555 [Ruegeria sp.]
MAEPSLTAGGEVPLTSYDHLLASAVTAVVVQRVYDGKREEMWLKILEDALPHVNRDHQLVDRMAVAAEKLIDFPNGGFRCSAHLDASAAVQCWSEWRIGRAQDVIRKAKAAV